MPGACVTKCLATYHCRGKTVTAGAGRSRPYHLNHVRGTNRMKQAFMRAGAALGSLCNMTVLSVLIDRRPVAALGLGLDYAFVQVSQP